MHRTYSTAAAAFPRGRKLIFQQLRMPDDSWNKHKLDIPLRRPFEIFIPNVCAIDMDTTGTWPFGRRLEDQVATRFLSMFLDMSAPLGAGRLLRRDAGRPGALGRRPDHAEDAARTRSPTTSRS